MTEYICGPILVAENKEKVIQEVIPIQDFTLKVINAESIVCIPKESIGIPFVVTMFIVIMILFSALGVIAGITNTKYK
jgi:hypothetical protein